MASLALQMAAVWSFDWPPADRTASWKYGLFPSVKEQVGRPLCPSFPTWVLPHSIAERERQCADCFNLETSLQNRRILLVCGVNQLQTDSLIMDHFKTFCWNTAAAAEVWVCEKELEGNQLHVSMMTFTSCTSSSRGGTFVYVHTYVPRLQTVFFVMYVNTPCC